MDARVKRAFTPVFNGLCPRMTGEMVTLRIDRDALDFFQADGPGWQERINQALRKVSGK